jgi:hypothetical protein
MEKMLNFVIKMTLFFNNMDRNSFYYIYQKEADQIVVHNCRTNGISFYTKEQFLSWYW